MAIEFDPAKDVANMAKHGLSLARGQEMAIEVVVEDDRFDELRYRAYGTIDGRTHCLAFVVRNGRARAISLRRAHLKEHRRHVR